jgi:hypothetical protein
MKLPGLPFAKKPQSDYFLALILQDEKVNSFIFEKIAQKITILGRSEEVLETPVDDLSYEELLDICDKVVSQAEEQTQKDLGTLKTIYGLKQNWITEAKIKKEYVEKLQKVSKELELAPVGFLTITDAIVNLIQKEEGAPPSAILADIGDKFVTVSLVKAGKIIETKTSEIHQSPVFTVDTLLKHLTLPEILPSKVFFVGDEELTQEFIGHQWSKSLPFLHLPQITNLAPSFIERAFVEGVAKEMRAEVVGPSYAEAPEGQGTEQVTEFQKDEAEIIKASETAAPEEEIENITTEPEKPKIEYLDNAQSMFGFVEGKDVAKTEPQNFSEPQVPPKIEGEQIAEIPEEVKIAQGGNKIVPFIAVGLTTLKTNLARLNLGVFKRIPIPLPGKLGGGKKTIIPVIGGLLLLSFLAWYFFFIKAEVVLSVKPRIEDFTQRVLFSTSKPSDFEANIIRGEFAEAEVSGSTSKAATGKKETGDKAKGTVTIFNSTDSTVTFPAKTTITSSNNLKFLTLDRVTVASQSGSVFEAKTPGKANVNVEADTFGTEYNLPSGTKFEIGSNPLIAAKNDNAFSGGTKKELTVVSQKDLDTLEEDLIKKLSEEAKTQVLNKVEGGKQILPEFADTAVEDPKFDKDVGDEAGSINLSGTVSYRALLFNRSDLLDYADKLAPDSSINRDNIKIDFKNIEAINNSEIEADLAIEARILPKFDENDIKNKISRKSFKEAEKILLSLQDIVNVTINFSPNIPLLPRILPSSNNIRIQILDNG